MADNTPDDPLGPYVPLKEKPLPTVPDAGAVDTGERYALGASAH